jgi:leader peptidase (prepilin peptidase)/N-methyltransferase
MSGLIAGALAALTAAGWLIGVGLRHSLNRLEYRIVGPRRDERDQPHPGSRWWVPATLALSWLGLGLAYADRAWPWLLLWLPYTVAGAWLAAVDLDVRRLPDKIQIVIAIYAAAAGAALIAFQHADWVSGLGGAAGCLFVFGLIHALDRNALGFGDVKHVAVVGWCLGLLGWMMVLYGLTIACLTGIGWALVRREREFAFGPWLILGAVAAGVIAGFTQTTALSVSLA